jgi:hypothetical protein
MQNEDGSVTPLPGSAPKSDPVPIAPFGDVEDEAPIYAAPTPSPDAAAPGIINRPPPKPGSPASAAEGPAMPQPSSLQSQPLSATPQAMPGMRAMPGPGPDPASAPQPPSPSSVNPTRANTNMTSTNLGNGSNVTLTPVSSAPAAAPAAAAAPGSALASNPASGIFSPQTAGAATSAFDRLTQAALQQNAPPPAPPKPSAGPAGPKSVEDLAREMLRPMLQQWMDANLPGMVERLVQQEIQRLTKR